MNREWCHFQRSQQVKKVGLVVEKLNQIEEKRRREGVAVTASTDATMETPTKS
jgi:hypothetical protein